jgi:uncharacterized protein
MRALGRIAVFLSMVAMLFAGCQRFKHKPLPEEDIHRITRELVFAANTVAPPSAEVHGEVGAFDEVKNSSDHVEIRIFDKKDGDKYPPSVPQMIQKFNAIALARGLTADAQSENDNTIFLSYRHAGSITHTVHIHMGGGGESRTSGSELPGDKRAPRLAIILDDLGNDRAAAATVFALPYPLTVSILPNQLHSSEIAQQARVRGDEVMLHLPMQSVGNEHPEARELRSGMSSSAVSSMVKDFLDGVPGATGVNNHQGSQSTADAKLMAMLMPVLKEHRLFYVDSRTSAATVAYDTAERLGVRAGSRNVPFLDDVEQVAAVRKQIQTAIAGAEKKKEAIAIGHAHPSTLEALKQTLPEARVHGVKLVFASELVR